MTPTHLRDDILNAWIDGVATDDERAIVHDHLATCETCSQRLGELRLVQVMLGDLGEAQPPRSFRLTPDQATKPTPIRHHAPAAPAIRLLPVVRALSVAAMIAVLVLGGALALRPAPEPATDSGPTMSFGMMPVGETGDGDESFQEENPAPSSQERGEVVDQGEAASAHDSTSDAISSAAQEAPADATDTGLTGLEIAALTTGVLAIVLGITWMGLSMSLRKGSRH